MLFSSPERSIEFLKDFPGFTGGLLEPLKWVLEKVGTGYGISLNPGMEFGFDMEPETVLELTKIIAAPKPKPN